MSKNNKIESQGLGRGKWVSHLVLKNSVPITQKIEPKIRAIRNPLAMGTIDVPIAVTMRFSCLILPATRNMRKARVILRKS